MLEIYEVEIAPLQREAENRLKSGKPYLFL